MSYSLFQTKGFGLFQTSVNGPVNRGFEDMSFSLFQTKGFSLFQTRGNGGTEGNEQGSRCEDYKKYTQQGLLRKITITYVLLFLLIPFLLTLLPCSKMNCKPIDLQLPKDIYSNIFHHEVCLDICAVGFIGPTCVPPNNSAEEPPYIPSLDVVTYDNQHQFMFLQNLTRSSADNTYVNSTEPLSSVHNTSNQYEDSWSQNTDTSFKVNERILEGEIQSTIYLDSDDPLKEHIEKCPDCNYARSKQANGENRMSPYSEENGASGYSPEERGEISAQTPNTEDERCRYARNIHHLGLQSIQRPQPNLHLRRNHMASGNNDNGPSEMMLTAPADQESSGVQQTFDSYNMNDPMQCLAIVSNQRRQLQQQQIERSQARSRRAVSSIRGKSGPQRVPDNDEMQRLHLRQHRARMSKVRHGRAQGNSENHGSYETGGFTECSPPLRSRESVAVQETIDIHNFRERNMSVEEINALLDSDFGRTFLREGYSRSDVARAIQNAGNGGRINRDTVEAALHGLNARSGRRRGCHGQNQQNS